MPEIIDLTEQKLPDTCYLFKHSTACPVSSGAADEVKASELALPIYWINVIQQRDLSNWVESAYDTKHESPQLLLIEDGKVSKVWNHRDIIRENF